jgi:hypothetical protein
MTDEVDVAQSAHVAALEKIIKDSENTPQSSQLRAQLELAQKQVIELTRQIIAAEGAVVQKAREQLKVLGMTMRRPLAVPQPPVNTVRPISTPLPMLRPPRSPQVQQK